MSDNHLSLEDANTRVRNVKPLMENALQLHLQIRYVAEYLVDAGVEVSPQLLAGDSDPSSLDNLDEIDLVLVTKLCAQSRALYQLLTETIAQIEKLGGIVHDVEDGMVDFHSFRDGDSEVFLSWKIGETRISHYRDDVAACAPRKPLGAHSFVSERGFSS